MSEPNKDKAYLPICLLEVNHMTNAPSCGNLGSVNVSDVNGLYDGRLMWICRK